ILGRGLGRRRLRRRLRRREWRRVRGLRRRRRVRRRRRGRTVLMLDPMRDVVEPFLAAADGASTEAYAAVLYGSLARGEYVPGRSDINLLVIFPGIWPRLLDELRPGLR